MKTQMVYELAIPEKVTVEIKDGLFKVKGPKGELQRKFVFPKVQIVLKDKKIVFTAPKPSKREKGAIFTTESHLKNMFNGVRDGCIYKLKICSGHFPMKVSYKNNVLEVKNYMGETVPRRLTIKPGVEVKIAEPEIVVTGVDLELTSQAAAAIEQLARRSAFDRRVFQDGIYITSKNGVDV